MHFKLTFKTAVQIHVQSLALCEILLIQILNVGSTSIKIIFV